MEEDPRFLTEQIVTYLGNKRSLLHFLGTGLEQVKKRLGKERLKAGDLFSGSGALGIECLSRRCTHCTFVDNDPTSYSVIQENLQNARLLASAALYRQNVQDFLSRCDQHFDLILMDPPYNRGHMKPALTLIHQRGLLKKGGLIVAESEKNGETVDDTYYTVRRTATYGKTVLTILQG